LLDVQVLLQWASAITLADNFELVARMQNQAISDVVRGAISARIEQPKKDPASRMLLRERIQRAR